MKYMKILFYRNHAKGEIHFARLHKDAMIEIEAFLNEREYQIDIFLL